MAAVVTCDNEGNITGYRRSADTSKLTEGPNLKINPDLTTNGLVDADGVPLFPPRTWFTPSPGVFRKKTRAEIDAQKAARDAAETAEVDSHSFRDPNILALAIYKAMTPTQKDKVRAEYKTLAGLT